jgi:hypothetical protein
MPQFHRFLSLCCVLMPSTGDNFPDFVLTNLTSSYTLTNRTQFLSSEEADRIRCVVEFGMALDDLLCEHAEMFIGMSCSPFAESMYQSAIKTGKKGVLLPCCRWFKHG